MRIGRHDEVNGTDLDNGEFFGGELMKRPYAVEARCESGCHRNEWIKAPTPGSTPICPMVYIRCGIRICDQHGKYALNADDVTAASPFGYFSHAVFDAAEHQDWVIRTFLCQLTKDGVCLHQL